MNTHADEPGEHRAPAAGVGRDTPTGPGAPPGPAAASRTPGANAPGDASGDGVPDAGTVAVESELDAARRERDEYLDMVRRLQADFENYKKRMLRQQTDQLERAAEHLVTNLLPALDAFDLARAHLDGAAGDSTEAKSLLQAAALLTDTLAKQGLERIDEAGVAFDPTTHDAVEHAPAADAGAGDDPAATDPAGASPAVGGPVVSEVLRSGYRWKGRVLRPAMVRVRG